MNNIETTIAKISRISKNFEESPNSFKNALIARVAHEVNRAYCQAISDNSQVEWEKTPWWVKESAINGVEFYEKNPDITPENIHENWMKEKIEKGWKYGPIKDPVNKEHPCLVPYNQLPIEQKIKDYLFRAVCKSLL